MNYSKQYSAELSTKNNFIKDNLEKVLRLSEILKFLNTDNVFKGEFVLDKKGRKQPDKALSDSESIPAKEDIESYMQKNAYPFNLDAYIDESKTKIGCEILFTRLFYKYIPPRQLKKIFNEIKELEKQETILMKKLFSN